MPGAARSCRGSSRPTARYLPFADASFDAVFHFGGVKLFSEPARALDEFVRVARPGALVAWGDEGFGAAAPTGWRRRVLERMNPGYKEPVPPPPAGVEDIAQHEVMAGCGWLMVGTAQRGYGRLSSSASAAAGSSRIRSSGEGSSHSTPSRPPAVAIHSVSRVPMAVARAPAASEPSGRTP